MGHLAVMDDSEAQFRLTSYSQRLWRELADSLPPEAEYCPCGSLWVAVNEAELAEIARKLEYYRSRGVPARSMDAVEVAREEPNLRPGLAGALLLPDDAVIYPPGAARHLLAEAQAWGVALVHGRVSSVSSEGVALEDGSRVAAGMTVIATGCDAARLAPAVQVRPRKGHLAITERYPQFLRHQIIELGYLTNAHSVEADSVAFNVQPRVTGQLLIGSSRQYDVEDPAVEQRMMNAMLRRALEYMPALGELSVIRCWTGFRPATPDNLPFIGPCPGSKNIFVAAGHEGLGISTSLGTARLLADAMLGRSSDIPREPYLPERACVAHA
jgi:glycine/D-amino acid oxidase-like deaminating enzyme